MGEYSIMDRIIQTGIRKKNFRTFFLVETGKIVDETKKKNVQKNVFQKNFFLKQNIFFGRNISFGGVETGEIVVENMKFGLKIGKNGKKYSTSYRIIDRKGKNLEKNLEKNFFLKQEIFVEKKFDKCSFWIKMHEIFGKFQKKRVILSYEK